MLEMKEINSGKEVGAYLVSKNGRNFKKWKEDPLKDRKITAREDSLRILVGSYVTFVEEFISEENVWHMSRNTESVKKGMIRQAPVW